MLFKSQGINMNKLFFKLLALSVALVGLAGCTPAANIDPALVDVIINFYNVGFIVGYGFAVVGVFRKKFGVFSAGAMLLIALYIAYYLLGIMYPAAGFGMGIPG